MYVFVQIVKNVKIDNDKRNGYKTLVVSVMDMLSLNSVMNHCKLQKTILREI